MRKKNRRIICDIIHIGLVIPIYSIFYYPAIWLIKLSNWIKRELRVLESDPD